MNFVDYFNKLSPFQWALMLTYFCFFAIQLFYYLYLFRKPYRYSLSNNENGEDEPIVKTDDLPGISIIITAKNEAENLERNLPFVLNQDYPNFQVVVVNSRSTDQTADL